MKRFTYIFLFLTMLLSVSCHRSDRDIVQNPEISDTLMAVRAFDEPVILLIYPDAIRAKTLSERIGSDQFYEISDRNGSYFDKLRSLTSLSELPVISGDDSRYKFVAEDGSITEIDLSCVASPWQVILFNGSASPLLSSPEQAIKHVKELFNIPSFGENRQIHPNYNAEKPQEPLFQETVTEFTKEEPSFPPETALIKETVIRLRVPDGSILPSLRDEATDIRVVTSYISPLHNFSLLFENDLFSNTDRYYTNGISLSYTSPELAAIPLNQLMLPSGNNSIVHATVSLHHAMFTPFTTKTPPLFDGDRPYSSTLFIRYSQTSENATSGILLSSSIDAGIIGDAALGKYLQKTVHATVPTNDEPLGWETQIQNDIILNYSAGISKLVMQNKRAEAYVSGRAEAGTLNTQAALGVDAITGIFASALTPIPENYGTLKTNSKKWQFGLRSGLEFRLKAYDATLQGGVLNRHNIYTLKSEEIERIVAYAHLGIFVRYRKTGISISQHYLSREIKNGKQHFWGQIGLNYNW